MEAMVASALVLSGWPGGAVATWPVATTGNASAKASTASSARTSANLTLSPSAVARLPRKSRSPTR
jgi:hypothetical protein